MKSFCKLFVDSGKHFHINFAHIYRCILEMSRFILNLQIFIAFSDSRRNFRASLQI